MEGNCREARDEALNSYQALTWVCKRHEAKTHVVSMFKWLSGMGSKSRVHEMSVGQLVNPFLLQESWTMLDNSFWRLLNIYQACVWPTRKSCEGSQLIEHLQIHFMNNAYNTGIEVDFDWQKRSSSSIIWEIVGGKLIHSRTHKRIHVASHVWFVHLFPCEPVLGIRYFTEWCFQSRSSKCYQVVPLQVSPIFLLLLDVAAVFHVSRSWFTLINPMTASTPRCC